MSAAEVRDRIAAAPVFASEISEISEKSPWPEPLAAEARHGLLGRLLDAIEPHSEADPAALLAHALAAIAALLGANVYALAGDAQHPARFNVAIVGETSRGRKGSAARPVERVLRLADSSFSEHQAEGLSSGEGLIWRVRDAIHKSDGTVIEKNVVDKRLLVTESEFASTLRVLQRDGNTLSAVVRRAWDSSEQLSTLTKNSQARSTGAHINIVAHVTRDELLRYLDRTELANGFANRFLWFAAKRSKLLPDGEQVPEGLLVPLADELRAVLDFVSRVLVLHRDAEATELWREAYAALAEADAGGMFGAVTSRAEAQVLRLSVLYAILDCAELVRAAHVAAALAVWEYCEASARWIFGDATGDAVAETILAALRESESLSRDEVCNLLNRHASRARTDQALNRLAAAGMAVCFKTPTAGRPVERWKAA